MNKEINFSDKIQELKNFIKEHKVFFSLFLLIILMYLVYIYAIKIEKLTNVEPILNNQNIKQVNL